MENSTTSSYDPWLLNSFGRFAARVIQLFVQPGKHVVKDSIVVDNEIGIPDLRRTLLLLFSRQASIVVAALVGIILTLATFPLFCILLRRACCPRKRSRTAEEFESDQPLQDPSDSQERPRGPESVVKRIVLSAAILASTTILILAAAGLLLCAIRLQTLRVQASDVTATAIRSIHEAAGNLQDDVRRTLETLSSIVRNQTEHSTITDIVEKKLEAISSNARKLSKGQEIMREHQLFLNISQEMLESVPDFQTNMISAENSLHSLQKEAKRLLSDPNAKIESEDKKTLQKITGLKDPNSKSKIDQLLEAAKSNVRTSKAHEKSISLSFENISQTVKNTERLYPLLKDRLSDLAIPIAAAGNDTFETTRQKFELFYESIDTLLQNKTAKNMRLWEGDLLKTVSAMDGRVLSTVLLSIGTAVFVLATTTGIGMAIGTASTECFNHCSRTGYATPTTAGRGGSLIAAGAYATSLTLWLLFVILFVSFAVGLYHVDACSSFEDYDIVDFRLGALLSFAEGGEIDVNRTAKAVMTTCRNSRNILEAVGREDLLMVNLSNFDIGPPDNSSTEPIISIDIPALMQAEEGAANSRITTRNAGSILFNVTEHIVEPIGRMMFEAYTWCERLEEKNKHTIPTTYRDVCDRVGVAYGKYTSLKSDNAKVLKIRDEAKRYIDNVYRFLRTSTELAEKMETFVGKSEGEFLNAVMTSYLSEMVEAMHSALNGTEVDHSTCVTVLREYDRAKNFACNKLLTVVALTWLMCLLITLFLALQMAASFPASRLFKPQDPMLDADNRPSDQQRSEEER